MRPVRWAVGITTTPSRHDLLSRTLDSVLAAGFSAGDIRLYMDGSPPLDSVSLGPLAQDQVTVRTPNIRAFGNWILGLGELLIRSPRAHFYAMFQDDIACVRNIRQYFESTVIHGNRVEASLPPPTRPLLKDRERRAAMERLTKVYWNLICYPENAALGVHNGVASPPSWYASNQKARGAQGLVFSKEAAVCLLTSHWIVTKPLSNSRRAWKAIDSGVAQAMREAGYREIVHRPSLLNHVGTISTLGNPPQPVMDTFPGEDFDAMTFLRSNTCPEPSRT